MSWEMTKQEDPGVSLSTKMTFQQAGADRTPDRNSPASRREVNAKVGGFGGFWHFIAWLQPPASSLQSSSGGEGGLSSGTLQLPGEKFMLRRGGSGGLWQFVAAHKKMDGALTLRHVSEEIQNIIKMTGLSKKLHIEA